MTGLPHMFDHYMGVCHYCGMTKKDAMNESKFQCERPMEPVDVEWHSHHFDHPVEIRGPVEFKHGFCMINSWEGKPWNPVMYEIKPGDI